MKKFSNEEWDIIYQNALTNFRKTIKSCLLRYNPHKYTTEEATEIASDLAVPLMQLMSVYLEEIVVQYNQEKLQDFINTPPSNLN